MAPSLNHQALALSMLIMGIWASVASCQTDIRDTPISVRHEEWMTRFGRSYDDAAEKERRLEIFKRNAEYVDRVNKAGDRKYKLGLNQFADMTDEEVKALRSGRRSYLDKYSAKADTGFRYNDVSDTPDYVDWREKGAVTPVKSQGTCGCCWAFSAVASTEGINAIKTGKLVSLSEQELVSCDHSYNNGCNGGLAYNALQFIVDNGLPTESDYPYTARDDQCPRSPAPAAARIRGAEQVPANSEEALRRAVAGQPVSVGVDSSGDFGKYESGVFTGPCGTNLDHDVAVVGYGTAEDGTKYWLVKNSWGTEWGENGYIRMQRDVEDERGLCGITMMASYPTL